MMRLKPLLVGIALSGFSLGAAATPMYYHADLSQLNSSGVSGTAELTYDSSPNTLTVHIQAAGLQPNEVHPQHIHGALSNGTSGTPVDSTSPTLAVDQSSNGGNGDGVIELGEGATTYGPILIPLTWPPGGALSGFPTAPNGTIDFTHTYGLADSGIYNGSYGKSDLFPLNFREIVLHGMSVPKDLTDGGVSYAAGEYDPVLPVASGEISQVAAVPEPGDFGMMLLGVALIGGVAFVRKRNHFDDARRVC